MNKISIYNYSSDKFLNKIQFENYNDFFEIQKINENADELNIHEILRHKFNVIEFTHKDYEQFKPSLSAIDWKVSQVGVADALILTNGLYRPVHLQAAALSDLIKKNANFINSQLPVIVVGEIHFVIGVVAELALKGFTQIVYSLSNYSESFVQIIEKKIRSFAFDINLKSVHINELTTSELMGALFISDFKKSTNKEAYELLTYFNFLSQGAVFIDCNSIQDSYLVDDARKAEIKVIDEVEFINQKYTNLLEYLKISSKV